MTDLLEKLLNDATGNRHMIEALGIIIDEVDLKDKRIAELEAQLEETQLNCDDNENAHRTSDQWRSHWQTKAGELQSKLDAVRWQPIETAPKDGTAILVNTGYAHDAWQYVTAHYRNDLWVACCSSSIVRPTHWMPLPEPPQALNGEGKS